MSKFNTPAVRPAVFSPIVTEARTSGVTAEGGAGYAREAKSELFLLAVTNMVGERTFYESADDRDERFERLIHQVAVADPEWVGRFLAWLRSEANMRTASLVGALEAAKAMLDAKLPGSRAIVADVLQRADEPGEALAYWTSRYGRAIPKPVKRGVADALLRLYTERSLLKYDTASKGFRFGDVIDLVHPVADAPWRGDLFKYALDRRHGRATEVPDGLGTVGLHADLMLWPVEKRRELFTVRAESAPTVLREAGMTWESVAGWLQGPLDRAVWEALIPSMGYMALLRNLRNFDEAGVSDAVASQVAAKLSDPEQVARSRQLPMRFLSAYRAAPSLRWSYPLEQALAHCMSNIPSLPGRTLVMVDTSGSMHAGFSKDGTLMRWDAAVIFGVALAQRCADAEVVSFSNSTKVFPVQPGESLLKALDRWRQDGYFFGNGTSTAAAIRHHYASHDRVVVVTDEQAAYDGLGVNASVPKTVPMYTWNLAGYQRGHAPSGGQNRHTFGGLTDQAFRMIPLLEAGRNADWPF